MNANASPTTARPTQAGAELSAGAPRASRSAASSDAPKAGPRRARAPGPSPERQKRHPSPLGPAPERRNRHRDEILKRPKNDDRRRKEPVRIVGKTSRTRGPVEALRPVDDLGIRHAFEAIRAPAPTQAGARYRAPLRARATQGADRSPIALDPYPPRANTR